MLINSDKKDIIFINAKACKPRKLLADIEQTGAAGRALKQNANYQLVIDNMLIKLQEDS
jgi:DNA polymerase-3 subunit delta'